MANARDAIGIDVGGGNLKLVYGRRAGDSMKIVFAESLPLADPTGALLEGRTITAMVADSLRRNGVKPSAVIAAVDRSSATVRKLSLPSVSEDELEKIIGYEAESHVPFALDSAEVAHYRLPSSNGQAHVMIAACPKKTVADRRAALKEAGAPATEVGVSTVATVNCLIRTDRELDTGAHLVADIGAETTEMAVVSDRSLLSSLTLAQGGQGLTLCLARDRGISSTEAEKAKTEGGIELDPAECVPSDPEMFSTTAWFQKLVGGLQRAIEAHAAGHEDTPIASVVLLGAGSALNGLSDAIANVLGVPVRYADPMGRLHHSPAAGSGVYSPAMATAAGLAMQGLGLAELPLDLTPREVLARRRSRARRGFGRIVAIGFVVVLIAATAWQTWRYVGARAAYEKQAESVTRAQVESQSLTLHPAEVSSLEQIVADATDPDNDPLDLMAMLADELPLEVSVRDLSFRRADSLDIRGAALSNAAVAEAVMALKASERFESVELTHSTATDIEGITFYAFGIECALPGGDAS